MVSTLIKIIIATLWLLLLVSLENVEGFDNIQKIRIDYYNLSHNKRALTIPITYGIINPKAVAAAFYTNDHYFLDRYIIINKKYAENITHYWTFRGVLMHELEHAIGNFQKHIKQQFIHINGDLCPNSLMNPVIWTDEEYETCYRKYQKEYEQALIKKVSIDKILKK